MGLRAGRASTAEVAASPDLRLDRHRYRYLLTADLRAVTQSQDGVPLAEPWVAGTRNGVNLPATAYDETAADPAYRYVSVGGLSQFALRPDRCVGLDPDAPGGLGADALTELSAQPDEVLLTRSGTPGIAWPAALADADVRLVPSGFLIGLRLASAPHAHALDPYYVAAVLNHPVWRVWTAALSAGKRQRNLSQDHLRQVRIPSMPAAAQASAGTAYASCLQRVAALADDTGGLRDVCDRVLRDTAGLRLPSSEGPAPRLTRVLSSQSSPVQPSEPTTAGTAGQRPTSSPSSRVNRTSGSATCSKGPSSSGASRSCSTTSTTRRPPTRRTSWRKLGPSTRPPARGSSRPAASSSAPSSTRSRSRPTPRPSPLCPSWRATSW